MAAGEHLSAGAPPGAGHAAPFVLTLELDGAAFVFLDRLRRQYVPPERYLVPAHLTLFHQLPVDHGREIKALLQQVASGQPPIETADAEVRSLGNGVAVFVRAPQLLALRDALAREWLPWLTAQDRHGFRPHVTIQNKVSGAEAKACRDAVAGLRLPRIVGTGLHLWRYRGGPWEDVRLFRFR